MPNLKQETLEKLEEIKKTIDDIENINIDFTSLKEISKKDYLSLLEEN